eukprot:TRINITY_DN7230_c0_g1_i1.p1 TRINITY_DN7230_c0_g1~~TRINITY_DN7230_c0_g1_i1.p1  ORF type:complete len:432 (+),score=39.66 TRINITY_DN7230_c0_g1_i1:27-1298(+)
MHRESLVPRPPPCSHPPVDTRRFQFITDEAEVYVAGRALEAGAVAKREEKGDLSVNFEPPWLTALVDGLHQGLGLPALPSAHKPRTPGKTPRSGAGRPRQAQHQKRSNRTATQTVSSSRGSTRGTGAGSSSAGGSVGAGTGTVVSATARSSQVLRSLREVIGDMATNLSPSPQTTATPSPAPPALAQPTISSRQSTDNHNDETEQSNVWTCAVREYSVLVAGPNEYHRPAGERDIARELPWGVTPLNIHPLTELREATDLPRELQVIYPFAKRSETPPVLKENEPRPARRQSRRRTLTVPSVVIAEKHHTCTAPHLATIFHTAQDTHSKKHSHQIVRSHPQHSNSESSAKFTLPPVEQPRPNAENIDSDEWDSDSGDEFVPPPQITKAELKRRQADRMNEQWSATGTKLVCTAPERSQHDVHI